VPIRPSNTVNIIKRRLELLEAGEPDVLELVGLHDELSRLERKWMMQLEEGSERRKPTDVDKLDGWFRRLQLQIERALRGKIAEPEVQLLRETLVKIGSRSHS
jgi:hypothetical protein